MRGGRTQPEVLCFGERPYPCLDNLLGGWFHQDFDIERQDLETIVPKHVKVSSDEQVRASIGDIERFIMEYGSDDVVLRGAVERVFDPEIFVEGWEGLTTREWLLRVKELLQQGLAYRQDAKR